MGAKGLASPHLAMLSQKKECLKMIYFFKKKQTFGIHRKTHPRTLFCLRHLLPPPQDPHLRCSPHPSPPKLGIENLRFTLALTCYDFDKIKHNYSINQDSIKMGDTGQVTLI